MTSSLLNCGELERKWKKMHEKESTLQPKDESDHFGFFYPSGGGYNVIGATVFPWAAIEDIYYAI